MKIRRRVELVIETRQTTVFRRLGERGTRWCPACESEVRMVTPEEATEATGMTARTVYGLVEAGRVHFDETNGGLLLVCLDSLAQAGEV